MGEKFSGLKILIAKSRGPNSYALAYKERAAPIFLHALENDQILLAHNPLGMGVPLTIFFQRGSKIGLKFDISVPVAFGAKGLSTL